MFGKTLSYTIEGIDAQQITVEADIKGGLARFNIVGLPSNSVKESRDRVSSAIKNAGFRFPQHVYTVNLAPADLRKDGVALDLPIAIALLSAMKQMKGDKLNEYGMVGEVSLDGLLRPVNGILPIAIAARNDGLKGLIVPYENKEEASIVTGIPVYGIQTLQEVVAFLNGESNVQPTECDLEQVFNKQQEQVNDIFDVKGQFQAKRVLEIAAAGGHNILMIGPPGSGKTMLARRMPTILPSLSLEESLETSKIYSVAGLMNQNNKGLIVYRPFRSPHHTISDIALIGGGSYPRPGEVSLAHNGILFLDELPEFKKSALEVLRQPLEDGVVTISRATNSITFPAKLMLVVSMNPCPCGYFGSNIEGRSCTCSISAIQKYRSRVSGPLLDRIDIHIEVPQLHYNELLSLPSGEHSETIRERVNYSRDIQLQRYAKEKIYCNAQMHPRLIRKYCKITAEGQELLKIAMIRMGLSARAYDRILKVARTIADLEGALEVKTEHISEAIQYRSLDKKFTMI